MQNALIIAQLIYSLILETFSERESENTIKITVQRCCIMIWH